MTRGRLRSWGLWQSDSYQEEEKLGGTQRESRARDRGGARPGGGDLPDPGRLRGRGPRGGRPRGPRGGGRPDDPRWRRTVRVDPAGRDGRGRREPRDRADRLAVRSA